MDDNLKQKVGLFAAASVGTRRDSATGITVEDFVRFEARDANGNLKWVEEIPNLVVTEGLNSLLTQYFKGSGYTATWFVGLIDNAGFTALAATDTAAKITTAANPPTTNGWQEITAYSESVRQTLVLGTASAGSIDNTASKAVFSINGTITVKGAFLSSIDTKGGTTGVLYGEAAFSATRSLVSGDTLTVTQTLTAASA